MDHGSHGQACQQDSQHGKPNEAEDLDDMDNANLHVALHEEKSVAGNQSSSMPSIRKEHVIHPEGADSSSDKLDVDAEKSHCSEEAGLMHELHQNSASHGVHKPNEHCVDDVRDFLKAPSAHGKQTGHESDALLNTQVHGTYIHDNKGAESMVSVEKSAIHEKHVRQDHEDSTHCAQLHDEVPVVISEESPLHGNTDGSHFSAKAMHRLDAEEGNVSNALREKLPSHGKLVHDGDAVEEIHTNTLRQEKDRNDDQETIVSHDYGGKFQSVDDDSESRGAFSDENSPRGRVHFSRGSTPDGETPTQGTGNPFSNPKALKDEAKGIGNAERGAGSGDGNPETPSSSWAFSTRASIAPSKFDHMATLRMTYGAYKESSQGKEGVPLSLLPEILESARFMVPPPRDLVPLLQRIDIEYKSGDLVRWSLLQSLALQIERKEARYPSVFIPRCTVARPNSNSPNSWKALQRSPSRRTHPEDNCPELEPQVFEMMKEIDNHRRKSAKEGNYLAADAAAQRLIELKLFEDNKRRATMLERHAQEREQAEQAYKEELQERNQLWDERLKNFQKEVFDHAQRLKKQHTAALQLFKEKMASKTPVKAQWSRELLKQRRIQSYLGKQGKYLEAEEVKQSADRMEQAELQAAIAAFQAEVISKEQSIRMKQQTEMDILLQRAARTREEIRKSRTLDVQRCHQRHKNVMRELAAIQKQEVFRFDQLMQKKVRNPYAGMGFGGQLGSQCLPSRSHVNALDYSTDDAVYSGGEDSSMKD